MKKLFPLFVLLLVSQLAISQVVINEIDCDTPGTDTGEFIELKSDTPNFPLDGYVLVLFNGSTSGNDSSYFALDLDGQTTDVNGLLLIGSNTVSPVPQLIIGANVIQNGADAVAIYQASGFDFPQGTQATTTNLIDAIVYDTGEADDVGLLTLLGLTEQISEGGNNNTNSIQRNETDGTYYTATPTPRQLNDGSGIVLNGIAINVANNQYTEGETFTIEFTTEMPVSSNLDITFTLDNGTFDAADYTGTTTVTIPTGQSSITTNITLVDDTLDEGDEELIIDLIDNFSVEYIILNDEVLIRAVDDDFTVAPFGTPLNPTFGVVTSTAPTGYYDTMDGLADANLRDAMQAIIADPAVVRAQTYADVYDILREADQNPANSNQVWLVYTEQGRAKLDVQSGSNNTGTWNREHTFPRSLAGYNSIEADDVADGRDVFWVTRADSLRHGNSDGHALRAADGPENSSRGNQHYGQYTGPTGTAGSFRGDVARSVFFLAVRYNGLSVENGFPATTGQIGDLATLLDWHRNDPPDDFEMNRNNVVYTWQFNRNPFIDHPELVEHLWGNQIGVAWQQPLSTEEFTAETIKLYPNPAKNHITIAGIQQEASIEIFSVDGRKLQTSQFSGTTQIPLQLQSGMYVAKITVDEKTVTKKIIIQ
ncbi:putative secreted protein (Por secretion system target) [Kordia periserrulae]|uniref:Putative secreted protein (Por secretion system target) n=1 Tax=Kordia periserrulae TaxID=701523 RepID=A0A2T6BZX0_9FLAO|nr:endonuclease [Kordia periserrulae]PTX61537.1 putative secreted protein (Por secretion system target) [Kordia periserrulae]